MDINNGTVIALLYRHNKIMRFLPLNERLFFFQRQPHHPESWQWENHRRVVLLARPPPQCFDSLFIAICSFNLIENHNQDSISNALSSVSHCCASFCCRTIQQKEISLLSSALVFTLKWYCRTLGSRSSRNRCLLDLRCQPSLDLRVLNRMSFSICRSNNKLMVMVLCFLCPCCCCCCWGSPLSWTPPLNRTLRVVVFN